MNWKIMKLVPFIDTRAYFLSKVCKNGKILDIGTSDGKTLMHFVELRKDLKITAMDIIEPNENVQRVAHYIKCDASKDKFQIENNSLDAITCMQLVEHINTIDNLLSESFRVLRPGGIMYIETPHPKTIILNSPKSQMLGKFTINFYDDPTHIRPISLGVLACTAKKYGFKIYMSGISRNIFIASLWPIYLFLPPSFKKYTSYVHFKGWSNFLIVQKDV